MRRQSKSWRTRSTDEIKESLGLREGVDYTIDANYRTLRYGRVFLMADADEDASHILGLVINMFYCRFRSLLARPFVFIVRTPVLRLTRGKEVLKFYSVMEYQEWVRVTPEPDRKKYTHKYFKGLGTSKNEHIIEEHKAGVRVCECVYDDMTDPSMRLAFDKKLSDERKTWIGNWVHTIDVQRLRIVPISAFIQHEVVQYSVANLTRSIPNLLDGLKPSQRKLVYGAMKKKKKGEIKVAELASYTSGETNYHHGEKSLTDPIVLMAQDFIGACNMPYFAAESQMGSRMCGGDDAVQPRYGFVSVNWWLKYVLRKEDVLIPAIEEGEPVEPVTYLPIIPMCLVNGACGIATGHSTFIPNHNPMDLCAWIRARILGLPLPDVKPWYRGFTGEIEVSIKQPKGSTKDQPPPVTEAAAIRERLENNDPDHVEVNDDDSSDEEETGAVKLVEQKALILKPAPKVDVPTIKEGQPDTLGASPDTTPRGTSDATPHTITEAPVKLQIRPKSQNVAQSDEKPIKLQVRQKTPSPQVKQDDDQPIALQIKPKIPSPPTQLPPPVPKQPQRSVEEQKIIDEMERQKAERKKRPRISMITRGRYENVGPNKVRITELPIGRYTHNYVLWLTALEREKMIISKFNNSRSDNVDIEVVGMQNPSIKNLRLEKSYGMTNMVLMCDGHPVHFATVTDILETFYSKRLPYYEQRRQNIIKDLSDEIRKMTDKARFIQAIIDKVIIIMHERNGKMVARKKSDIEREMEALKIPVEIYGKGKLTNLSEEDIAKLEREIGNYETRRKAFMSTSATKLWLDDLDEFVNAYLGHYGGPHPWLRSGTINLRVVTDTANVSQESSQEAAESNDESSSDSETEKKVKRKTRKNK